MISRKILSLSLVMVALSLISWGVIGHRTIGKIAENHLTPKAKTSVYALLGTETMPLVSTYADEIRSLKQYSYTGPWHYVNLKQGLNFNEYVSALKADTGANVYNALLKMEKQLKDPKSSKADKIFALKFIIHLVSDLHQPFHVGRGEDKGGNDIKVKFRGRETNLHSLWDSGLIEYNGLTYTEMATAFDNLSEAKIKKWQSDDVTVWLYESYQIASKLYAEADENPDFDHTYYPRHEEIYKERMQQAAIRLAGFLNKIFK
jgi:hypothetical protein